jgi:hypothetical protein
MQILIFFNPTEPARDKDFAGFTGLMSVIVGYCCSLKTFTVAIFSAGGLKYRRGKRSKGV